MPETPPKPILNHLLARLESADFALLQPDLKMIETPLRKMLEPRNRPIEHVYFFESGFGSVVANGGDAGIEVGIIGREGMTGMAVLLGANRTPHDTFVQGAGTALRISTGQLRKAIAQSPSLKSILLLFVQAFAVQMSCTAIANGRGKLEARLARWLLMAHDRSDGDRLFLTQEFLAQMLSVRRAGVTVAIGLLAKTGTIKITRGAIDIVDRKGLEEESNGSYGVPEAEYQRLLG
jgi:CRP-like cAMP-binding protein